MLEQIEKIKENTHKVYRSGQLSVFSDNECLQGKVSGRVVSMSDVAPIEHNLWHKETSRNLFDKLWLKTANVLNGVAGSVAFDGDIITYTLTSTSTAKRVQMLFPKEWFNEGKQYTISLDCSIVPNIMVGTASSISDTSSFNTLGKFNSINYGTFTAKDLDKDFVNVFVYLPGLAVGETATISNIQLELGDTVTDYVPHIIDVDGVKLASKNLFDVNNATLINGYIAGDNTINMTTLTRSVVIECKPNTTYTVSKVLSARFSLGYTAEFPKQDTPCVQSGGTSQVTEKTITTDSTAKYLVVYCYHSNYDTDISVEDILNTLQIEQGTTATKHTPYIDDFSNITLTRAENIGKYVFTGEEAFYLAGSGFPYGIYIHSNGYVTDNDTTSNIKMWCTHFECVHNSEIDNENATFTFCQYSKNWYFNYDCQKGGVANFKEWLRQNYKNGTPVTVYYRKVDTTDEDFTDYTANADGTVEGVKSISPNMTLIPNNNAVSVECEYLRDIDLYIDNLITGIALTGGN